MAVQAQYPSNVHEYSLQPQPDQSNNIILFNTPGIYLSIFHIFPSYINQY
jgi:hypothetical protein